MFNLFKNFKTNVLLITNLLITSTTLLYLISIHGFSHLNKELINNTLIAIAFGVTIITILIGLISFMLYIAFRTTYKKFNDSIETITKTIEENIDKKMH